MSVDQIRVGMRDRIDPREDLWDYDCIAAYAKLAPSHVQNRVTVHPDFPTPIRATGPRAHPRWVAGEVMDWFKRHAEEVKRDLAASVVKSAGLEEENSKLRSALAIVHFKREPWQ